jgi:hypothetical protein
MDKLLSATMPVHVPRGTDYALDATAIDSYARGKRRHRADPKLVGTDEEKKNAKAGTTEYGRSFDPDATWIPHQDLRQRPLLGIRRPSRRYRTGEVRRTEDCRTPVARPRQHPGIDEALRGIDSLADRASESSRNRVTNVFCDRGFSYATSDRWADQLRRRKVEQTIDIHPKDHGVKDFEGVRMIDGTPDCPSTPDHLVVIDRPANLSLGELGPKADRVQIATHHQRAKEIETFRARIAERRKYAFERNTAPDVDGKERWKCPAQAGKLICANCPLSQALPEGTPTLQNPPQKATAPKACHQVTITVPGDVTAKLRQPLYWGSDEWIEEYKARSAIEAAFGNLKNPDTEHVKRGWIRVVGYVKTAFMLTMAQAASNLRQLRVWATRVDDYTDPLTARTQPGRRTSSHYPHRPPALGRRARGAFSNAWPTLNPAGQPPEVDRPARSAS